MGWSRKCNLLSVAAHNPVAGTVVHQRVGRSPALGPSYRQLTKLSSLTDVFQLSKTSLSSEWRGDVIGRSSRMRRMVVAGVKDDVA